jgi:hypothetical protein
MAKDM